VKVLLTGAGGFIPSHVGEALVRAGHEVRALVRYNGRGSWGHLGDSPLRAEFEVVLGDVCDAFQMLSVMRGCDAVVHMAALIGIPYSYQAPASYLAVNVHGTLNVLEAARQNEVGRVLVTSTSEVYGTARYTPIDEEHALQAQSPYSASKIAADHFAEAYARSFGVPAVVVRPFNTYGPRQSARAVIPTILAQLLSGVKIVRLGSLSPRRDLTFVEDTARAFLLALTAPGLEGQVVHFGRGEAVSIGEIVERCMIVTGVRAQVETDEARVRPANSEVELLLCNPEKAKRMLGWKAEVGLDEGLGRTAEYVSGHLKDYQPEQYTV
jgi:NAD dependent epimerase/dehydratase